MGTLIQLFTKPLASAENATITNMQQQDKDTGGV